jgi:two-component system LytT family sensor kinase
MRRERAQRFGLCERADKLSRMAPKPFTPSQVPFATFSAYTVGASLATFYTDCMSSLYAAPKRIDPEEPADSLWPIIWTAGGLCWLSIAILGLLWSWPSSGTTTPSGDYVVSSTARLVHHVLLFLVSACAYRVALGQGWPIERHARVRVVAVHVALALLVARISPLLLTVTEVLIDRRWSNFRTDIESWLPFQMGAMQWVGLLRFWVVPYVLGLITVAWVHTARKYHRETVRLARLSTEVANLRMAMLSAQLHPHFLFNALHAISELINESPAQATTMVARLGDFLRIALESTKRPWLRVEAEVIGLDAYLAVQQTRFRDRLSVELHVDPAALNTMMPALLLQPIVENAIEHGRCGAAGKLTVKVGIRRDQTRLLIEVTNSTPRLAGPLARSSFGGGLRNVESRLRAAFGDDASVVVGPDATRGTRATLDMPGNVALSDSVSLA